MARMIPSTPIGTVPPAVARVFGRLKALPEGYTVWQRLGPQADAGPDFWVCDERNRVALIAVSAATARDARQAQQASLFDEARIGEAEGAALQQFAAAHGPHLPRIVVFPAVGQEELERALPATLPPGIVWASRDDLAPETIAPWMERHLSAPLRPGAIDALRVAFTPEAVVPAALTVRLPKQRGTGAGLTDYLLSYDQEWAVKHDLTLSDEAQAAQGALNVQLLNGVAGSGKSLVLVYRARLLHQFFPSKRILVLTHNKPLIRDLRARFERLDADRGGLPVEWRTFHGWCIAHWPVGEPLRRPIGSARRAQIVGEVWQQHLAETTVSQQQLADEIDWLKDRLITTREEYMAADRSGRGFALGGAMRQRVYGAIVAYHQRMAAQGWYDYGDVPRGMWRALGEGRAAPPNYDFVLIDEAQFFAPIWFDIIKQVLTPETGQLFLVADPTQGFLKRRQSWLASGLQVRGRSYRLEHSYRTTRAILDFAARFYQMRLPDDADALVPRDLQQLPEGVPPAIIALDSEQDELTRVTNEIRALRAAGTPPEHIMVLHASWQGVDRVRERLTQEFGAAAVANPRDVPPGAHIRVCTLNAATGLESPIVFVLGTHTLIEAEGSLWLNEEERAELVRDNTRKLYMALTRAGQRLALTYVGELPPVLQPFVGSAGAAVR